MLPYLLLVTIMLLATTHAGWTVPKRVFNKYGSMAVNVLNVYRDPTSSVNHVFYTAASQRYHQALLDDGTELYKTAFNIEYHDAAILRGAGDGKRLFLVYNKHIPDMIMFVESSDGGKSWSVPVNIIEESNEYRVLTDMLYVNGRLFVFFIHSVDEAHEDRSTIEMISRAANSTVFSQGKVIAKEAMWSPEGLVASYERQGKKTCLHVAYNSVVEKKSAIWYTRSVNNGASWSKPREIKGTTGYWIKTMRNIDEHLYIVYSLASSSSHNTMMVRSANHGTTFSAPISFNMSNNAELATCTSKQYKRLATFHLVKEKEITYALWNPATMSKVHEENYTTSDGKLYSTGIDCAVDETTGERKIPAFFSKNQGYESSELYFTVNTENIAAAE
ncbi:MAG: sialidase family protein [Candidatus Pacebacteria bacterium]|nr:sialidase family protein [Candidatus Paceibacterota bacterium]